MPRPRRFVIPGLPHHVTQRGNYRQQTFFQDADYLLYLRLLRQFSRQLGVTIQAYCLMPNHVHLIAVPESEDGLRRAIGEAQMEVTLAVPSTAAAGLLEPFASGPVHTTDDVHQLIAVLMHSSSTGDASGQIQSASES